MAGGGVLLDGLTVHSGIDLLNSSPGVRFLGVALRSARLAFFG